jgi:peptidoglycan/LPS O-acetylase OafA/YrhL
MLKSFRNTFLSTPNISLDSYFKGSANTLNLARAVLALLVCISHIGWIYGKDNFQMRSLGVYAVAIFFGISGFLIRESANKTLSWKKFLTRRIRRIFPAFLGVLIATSLIYYPTIFLIDNDASSHLIISEQLGYFFKNATLYIFQPEISNSLANSVTQDWNPSLWTLKYEFLMYVLCFLIVYNLRKSAESLSFFLLAVTFISARLLPHYSPFHNIAYLGQFYFFGMVLWIFRKKVPPTNSVLGLLALSVMISYLFINDFPVTSMLATLLVLGLSLRSQFPYLQDKDFSYGIYLHAGPITHIAVEVSKNKQNGMITAYFLTLIFTIAAGAASWLLIESKFLHKSK